MGHTITAADEIGLPFLWTAERGMRRLPTLGGDSGQPNELNEFGQIAGTSMTANGAFRATLWTPTAESLAVAPTNDAAAAEGAAQAE